MLHPRRDFDLDALDEYAVKFETEPYVGRILFILFSFLICVIALNVSIRVRVNSRPSSSRTQTRFVP